MTVLLDVTGFFYRKFVDYPAGGFQTVKEVMEAARLLPDFPKLDFLSEVSHDGGGNEVEFLKTIIVEHSGNTALSGQTVAGPNERRYADGTYIGSDDTVLFPKGNKGRGLISPEGKKIINAWQYYLYEEVEVGGQRLLVDVNRSAGSAIGRRKVEPFSEPFMAQPGGDARGIKDGDLIVWRQVSIAIEPTLPAEPLVG
ncbi:MAG: hypothetical protein AAGK00_10670 [Pseudomonadota bacterium]